MPIRQYQVREILKGWAFLFMSALSLAACNLQTRSVTPTSAPSPLPTNEPTSASTPLPLPPTPLFNLGPPPLTTPGNPTPLLPTITPISGAVPTVNATEADAHYQLQARAGKTVGINYVVVVTTGSVTVTLQGPGGVAWQKTFTASESGRAEVTVQQAGTYDILAKGDHFDGSYNLSWD